jgi:hypothetical protein
MMTCLLLTLAILAADEKATDRPKPTIKLIAPKDKQARFQCEVTNPGKSSWYFLGYSLESMAPKLPVDRIAPIPTIQHRRNGKWVTAFDGRCGVGMGPIELPAGTKAAFDVIFSLSDGDEARVGITILSTKEWKDSKIIWSEPIKGQREQ